MLLNSNNLRLARRTYSRAPTLRRIYPLLHIPSPAIQGLCMFALVWMLTGCVGGSSPAARVLGVQAVEATGEGVRFEVEVAVANPRASVLPVGGTRYKLMVEGVGTAEVEAALPVALPGRSTGERQVVAEAPGRGDPGVILLRLPAAMPWPAGETDAVGRRWRVEGVASYREPGNTARLAYESGLPLSKLRFHGRGVVERGQRSDATLRSESDEATQRLKDDAGVEEEEGGGADG